MELKKFIETNLTNVSGGLFGIDTFTFFNLRCECLKIGFLGGGVHRFKIYNVDLNDKLVRKYNYDFESVLDFTKRYAKIEAKKQNILLSNEN